jgi:hypothetical protein
MTIADVVSVASIVLAIVAIVLSIIFFRMSSQLSEQAKSAAERIDRSVEQLEKLFNMLYSDTFALMKDTYQDMRKHAWPEGTKVKDDLMTEAEKKTDEKLDVLKESLSNQLDRVLSKQMRTEGEVAKVKKDVQDLVGRAISESRKVEEQAREEAIRDHIVLQLKALAKRGSRVNADTFVDMFAPRFNARDIIRELERMQKDGIISYSEAVLGPTTEIRLGKP